MREKRNIMIMALTSIVVMFMIVIFSTENLQAAPLSKKEKCYYTKILKSKQYVKDTESSIYGLGEFLLYDVNNDGRKELIVSGPLGLRSAFFSIIYSYDGKNFYKSETIEGEVTGVSKKGIEFTYNDYSGAGEERYDTISIYKLSSKGRITEKLREYSESEMNLPSGIVKEKVHYYSKVIDNKIIKINKKEYKKIRKKFSLKTTGTNYSYEMNGKLIHLKYDIQVHSINNKNIKKFLK